MTARYAIYDTRTDNDVAEFDDLASAFAEIDRMREHYGLVHAIRIARQHREATTNQRETRQRM